MDTSKERIVNLFFKEIGIDHPTQDQISKVELIDKGALSKPMIKRMLDEGKTSGEIAQRLQVTVEMVKSRKKRYKMEGSI